VLNQLKDLKHFTCRPFLTYFSRYSIVSAALKWIDQEHLSSTLYCVFSLYLSITLSDNSSVYAV